MLTRTEVDRKFARQVLKDGTGTPLHSAAERALLVTPQPADADSAREDGTGSQEQAERGRDRIQHEADPYLHEVPDVEWVDLDGLEKLSKAFRDADSTPSGYPPMRLMDAEDFRSGPPGQVVPLPAVPRSPNPGITDSTLFSRPRSIIGGPTSSLESRRPGARPAEMGAGARPGSRRTIPRRSGTARARPAARSGGPGRLRAAVTPGPKTST